MNENQKTGSSVKRKLIITAFSALICILVIGISVWAALSQTVTLNNNITITTAGQTKVAVEVFEASNRATTGITAVPGSQPNWGEAILTKDASTNTASDTLSPMDFSVADGINYYAYKITFENSGTTEAYAHISASAVNNTQLKIFAGTTWAGMTEVTNNTAIDGDVTLTANTGTGEYYIMVASSVDISELNDMSQTPFNVSIIIDQSNT